MNLQKITRFLRQNLIFYSIGFFLLFGIKYFYSKAGAEDLRWILGPTARWVEALSGIPFVYEYQAGYVNHSLRFLIAPSCSGVQFLIITAAMLIFSFVHEATDSGLPDGHKDKTELPAAKACPPSSGYRYTNSTPSVNHARHKAALAPTGKGICWILISLLLSYLFTVFVNGLRIIAAIYLPLFFERFHILGGFLTADRLHTMIGAVVYFAALLTIHQLVGFLFRKNHRTAGRQASVLFLRRCLSPVFWYFFIVLGLPFLNRAYLKGSSRFFSFALLVTFCCGFVLLLYGLTVLICRRLKGRN